MKSRKMLEEARKQFANYFFMARECTRCLERSLNMPK